MNSSTKYEAERLAALGYKVFPVRALEKTPATPRGCKDATSNLDQVEAWFGDNSPANLAVATDGLVVVDVDGASNDWLTPERAVELSVGAVTMTPRGGRHFWFRAPAGVDVRCSVSQIAKNVDIRANGGYVLVPPSRTAAGGYRYIDDCELTAPPDELPLPPRWLLDAIFSRAEKTPGSEERRADAIWEGARNQTLTSVAGRLRRAGLEQEEIEAALQEMNARRCSPPLPPDEVAKIARSIARYEPARRADEAAELIALGDLLMRYPHLDAPVVDGIARFGEVINIISKSKVGKSWLVYSLALSIASGRDWLERFACTRSRVLLIDTELKRNVLASRIPAVAEALGVEEYENQIDIVTLRGSRKDIFDLQEILNASARGRWGAVIIDALYKLIPASASENDNAAIAAIYAALDSYAEATGAALFVVHHASKGSQSEKDITDVGAGAGAQSRAADTHLILRPHAEDNCVVLDAAVRSFAPLAPVGLRWRFPIWTPAEDIDPAELKGSKAARDSEARDRRFEDKRRRVLEFLSRPEVRDCGASFSTIRDGAGINHSLLSVLNDLADAGLVATFESTHPRSLKATRKWRPTGNAGQF